MPTPGPKPRPEGVGPRRHHKKVERPQAAGEMRKPTRFAKDYPVENKLWNKQAKQLEEAGITAGVDSMAFRLMLHHYRIALQAMADMSRATDDGGLLLTRRDENLVERKNPLLQVFRDNSTKFLRYAEQFGMTPSARGRLQVDKRPTAGEQLAFENLLNAAATEIEAEFFDKAG